jgi:elongation factor P--(R)-beta-lysine ligase
MTTSQPYKEAGRETPWFHPDRHEDRRGFLLARHAIMKALRQWFDAEGFLEVDAPSLVVSPGNEAHLHAFATQLIGPDGTSQTRYLHTSPEFAMKKLIAAGETKIFSLGHVFRNRERTPSHAPEFTMLEWYRALAPYEVVIEDTLDVIRLAATVTQRAQFSFKGRTCNPGAEAEYLSVADAFQRYAKVDLMATLSATGVPDRDALAKASPVDFGKDESWSDIFSRILVEKVEPHLGQDRMTVLYHYPSCEAALARVLSGDARVAERFEIYACGLELCNGFGELTDAAEQRRRFEADMDLKEARYGERYPLDEELLAALPLMPETSGVALGLDRVIMLATGAARIDQVLWVPG